MREKLKFFAKSKLTQINTLTQNTMGCKCLMNDLTPQPKKQHSLTLTHPNKQFNLLDTIQVKIMIRFIFSQHFAFAFCCLMVIKIFMVLENRNFLSYRLDRMS